MLNGWIFMIDAFFLLGFIILLGFFGIILFDKTKVSEVIILIIFGFLIGPVLGIIDSGTGSVISEISPFMGTLALILILFSGGLNLNIFKAIKEFPVASSFTVLVFLIGMIGTGLVMQFIYGWDLLYGLLLGAVVGGTTSAIVTSMVEKAKTSEDVKTMLILESTISDVLVIVVAFVLLGIISADEITSFGIANMLAGSFSIAAVFGLIAAVAWVISLSKMGEKSFSYMLTIAIAFLVYAACEAFGGNGSFGVFIFGLLLGNVQTLSKIVYIDSKYFLSREIKQFQNEVTFIVRTFFFVYIGLLFSTEIFKIDLLLIAVVLSLLYMGIRYLIQKLIVKKKDSGEGSFISFMLPRGLAAAVMAGVPLTKGINIPNFMEITLLIILITNVLATVGLFLNSKSGELEDDLKKIPVKKKPGKEVVDEEESAEEVENELDSEEIVIDETPKVRKKK